MSQRITNPLATTPLARAWRLRRWSGVFLALTLAPGCRQTDPRDVVTSGRLRALAVAYADFLVARGRGPADQKQLLSHFSNLPPFAVSDVASDLGKPTLVISARDGEPFVIRFGVVIADVGAASKTIVAFEKTGLEGNRFVVNLDGSVESLDTQTLQARGMMVP